jgi:hypothetical protein
MILSIVIVNAKIIVKSSVILVRVVKYIVSIKYQQYIKRA